LVLITIIKPSHAQVEDRLFNGMSYVFSNGNDAIHQSLKTLFFACEKGDLIKADSTWNLIEHQHFSQPTEQDSATYYFMKGYYLLRRESYDKSILNISKAQNLFESLHQSKAVHLCKLLLISVEFYIRNYQTAFQRFRAIAEQENPIPDYIRGKAFSNAAACMHSIHEHTPYNNWDSAKIIMKDYYMKAISFFESVDEWKSKAITYSILCALENENENYEAAKLYASKAWDISYTNNLYAQMAFIRIKVSGILHSEQNYQLAIDTLLPALNYYDSLNDRSQITHVMLHLTQSYKGLGDYETALFYSEKIWSIKEQMHSKTLINNAARYKVQFATQDKERALILKEKELARQTQIETEQKLELVEKKRLNTLLFNGILALFIAAIIVFIIYRKRQNKILLNERADGLKAVIDAQEKERERIGRDLHDGLCQTLGGLKLQQMTLTQNIEVTPKLKTMFEESYTLMEDAYDDARNLSHQLTPSALMETGLGTALDELVRRTFLNTSIVGTFQNQINETQHISTKIATAIYRITQELLSNIIKHSKATNADIEVYVRNAKIFLIVEDNGIGLTKNDNNNIGIGMKNIKSRLSVLNGEMSLNYNETQKTTFIIRIPLD